jgi:pimeloyl-ACP methyl ester carboxylesterase
MPAPTQNWQDVYFTSRDGLRLYARLYPSPGSTRRPALCLPGLTRNSLDFHGLATFLSDPANPCARPVLAVDYRGRGRSAADPDWRNYTLQVELWDVLDLMTITGLHEAAVIGSSRGGLIAMFMAAMRPGAIGAVVLNDIGPVIERDGLLRIVAYVGRVPLPQSWEEAAALVRDLNSKQFPAVPDHHWEEIARQWFRDDHGRPDHGYDQKLGEAIAITDGPVPDLWPQFEALKSRPTLILRGELSDMLSEATVKEMRLRHPRLQIATVTGQGHAPLLRDRATQVLIAEFLAKADPRPLGLASGSGRVRAVA